jgi:hypothetical protein
VFVLLRVTLVRVRSRTREHASRAQTQRAMRFTLLLVVLLKSGVAVILYFLVAVASAAIA